MSDKSGRDSVSSENVEELRIEDAATTLRRQFAEYDMLLEATGVCIVKLKMACGLPVDWCNEAAYRLIGYTREEYEAHFGYDLRSYFRGRRGPFRTLVKNGVAALRSGKSRFQMLIQLPCRSGFFWAQCTGIFADVDPKTAKPASVYGVFTDVTTVVESRERLARADSKNEWLAGILDNIPAGVSVCMVEKGQPVSITINRHLAEALGVEGGNVALHDLDQLLVHVHEEDRAHCRKALSNFFQRKIKLDMICRLRCDRGTSYCWSRVEGRVVNTTDVSEIAYLTYTDISALKDAEKMLRAAVVSANLLVWEYDIPTHTIYMADNETTSEECLRFGFGRVITGVPESLAAVVDERSMPALLAMYRKVEAGESASCEIWYKRKTGYEPHCERVSYRVELDEQGRAVRAYAVGVDITAKKGMEERYAREQSFLRENRDFNLISKGHYNLTKNKVLEYTMQAEKTPGGNYFDTGEAQSYDDAAAALLRMPCPEEDRAALAGAVDRQTLLRRYQAGLFLSRAQYRRLTKGELPLWMSVEMRTYMAPLTGDVECFSYTYDITDKVRNEKIMNRIAATEFDYVGLIFTRSETFEFLQKSKQITFPELNVRTYYAACCEHERKHFVGIEELRQYEEAVSLSNILAGLEASGRWRSTFHWTEDGKVYCKQMDYSWLDREERIVLTVCTDISASYERDQRQLARMREAKLEAERANEAKSAFLSSMSHDMRTPLNAVLGFSDLALREEEVQTKQEYLRLVQSSGALLLELVNDTLELSRIESGKLVLEPEAVNCRELWKAVISSLRPAAELKKISLVPEFPDRLEETIWVDRLKLQKVLLNLISNAIKYTPAGGKVRASVKRLFFSPDGYNRRITVEDNGIGISPEFLPEVFEPFAQERRVKSGAVSGTGLGLSIVKRIVDLMGGRIRVRSKVDCGTRFLVDLSIVEAEAKKPLSLNDPDARALLVGKKVLLCEDNDLNARIVLILLKEKGIEVTWAADGKAGAKVFADSPAGYYDAVLMDIRMPVLDGYGATRKIRALQRADAQSIPILAMTADAFEEDRRRALEAGMDGFLAKPIDVNKFFHVLADVLQHGRSDSFEFELRG